MCCCYFLYPQRHPCRSFEVPADEFVPLRGQPFINDHPCTKGESIQQAQTSQLKTEPSPEKQLKKEPHLVYKNRFGFTPSRGGLCPPALSSTASPENDNRRDVHRFSTKMGTVSSGANAVSFSLIARPVNRNTTKRSIVWFTFEGERMTTAW